MVGDTTFAKRIGYTNCELVTKKSVSLTNPNGASK